ncbi:hypothetical protein CMV_024427 [Castanea mollissima]|uniref:Uncharacterized protein n=1 Tax=Castanea mollissima TaxID=60419 RepID=A0A8J4VHZ5_9ROSI|nr:hypothetical protein CMV_024427 [Castanea mollissima]
MTDFLGLILKLIFTKQVAGDQTPVASFCGKLDLETAAKYERRRENFFNELEIVFANVLHLDANSGVTLKIKGM